MLEIMLIQYMNCASQILEIVEWLESLKIFAIFWWLEFERQMFTNFLFVLI